MKLGRHDVVFLNTADEIDAIIGGCQDDRVIIGYEVIGMHEIKLFIACQAFEQPGWLPGFDAVPPNVGYGQIDIKAFDKTREDTQPFLTGGLFAAIEQGMHAQADAQKRPAGCKEGL